jgi:hypothetical protein
MLLKKGGDDMNPLKLQGKSKEEGWKYKTSFKDHWEASTIERFQGRIQASKATNPRVRRIVKKWIINGSSKVANCDHNSYGNPRKLNRRHWRPNEQNRSVNRGCTA